MAQTFTPKEDDVLNGNDHIEIATVKQASGYLAFNGAGDEALEYAIHSAEERGGRVVVKRTVTYGEWEVVNAPESIEIPDALPDDFA